MTTVEPNPREPGGIPDDVTLEATSTAGLNQLAADHEIELEDPNDREKLIKLLQKVRD